MHITGENIFLTDLKSCSLEHVIYGDCAKERIIDKEKLQYLRLPPFNDVI